MKSLVIPSIKEGGEENYIYISYSVINGLQTQLVNHFSLFGSAKEKKINRKFCNETGCLGSIIQIACITTPYGDFI